MKSAHDAPGPCQEIGKELTKDLAINMAVQNPPNPGGGGIGEWLMDLERVLCKDGAVHEQSNYNQAQGHKTRIYGICFVALAFGADSLKVQELLKQLEPRPRMRRVLWTQGLRTK